MGVIAALLSLLMAFRPDGFYVGISYGMPSENVSDLIKSGNALEAGIFWGDARKVGITVHSVSLRGIDERYNLRFWGFGPEFGIDLSRISLSYSLRLGDLERNFEEGRETGTVILHHFSGSFRILSREELSILLGLDAELFPASKGILAFYGIKIKMVLKPWD